MDGADKRAWHLYEEMVKAGALGSFVGRTVVVRGLGSPQPHSPPYSWREWKLIAALAACFARRDYRQFKHLLPGARRAVAGAARESYDAVLVCFLFAMPLARPFLDRPIRLVVDTHNYDAAWYASMASSSRNPLLRHLCRVGIRYSQRALRRLPTGTVLVHVSEADAKLYRQHRPDLEHVIVENGTTVRPRSKAPDYGAPGKKTLIFVGSLSAKMNQDALQYFASRFWPVLRETAELSVVGSNPPVSVDRLCRAHGWSLHANVTEEQLERAYQQAHFALLPFEYGEGSKLKFLEACGRGVPVLATSAGLCGMTQFPELTTASDSPEVWARRLEARVEPEPQKVRQLVSFAEQFSWENLSRKLLKIIESAPLLHERSAH
jgi:glycosyltransferase involved in cell wall biosynthesis